MELWELTAPRELRLRSQPDPEPGPGQLMVEVAITAVSPGTELHAYRTGPSDMMTAPGYLAAGVVRSVGAGLEGAEIGRRVVLSAPHGSVAVVDAATATEIPDGVPFETACLTHLAGLGHACLHAGGYRAGDDVAVVGAGLVGMCTALVAELSGARVHILDILEERLDLPRSLGLFAHRADRDDLAEDFEATSAAGPAVVVDTSGSWSGLHSATVISRKGTRICVLGVNRRPPSAGEGEALFEELLSFPARFHYEGLHFIGCAGHPRGEPASDDDWTLGRCRTYLLEAMAQGRLDLSPLISDRVSPGDLSDVMEAMDGGDGRALGVVIDWRDAPK